MTPTKFLIGQITIVFMVAIGGLWLATEWTAWKLGYQPQLGLPWFTVLQFPIYRPWSLFGWWYAYDAYPMVAPNYAAQRSAFAKKDRPRPTAH